MGALAVLAVDGALLGHVDVADQLGLSALLDHLDLRPDHHRVVVQVVAPGDLGRAGAGFDEADRTVVGRAIEAEAVLGEDRDGGVADQGLIAALDGRAGILAGAGGAEADGGAGGQDESGNEGE